MKGAACPGCGAVAPADDSTLAAYPGASIACSALYSQLSARTLVLGDSTFVHQHAVDAYAAQHLVSDDPPIRGAFALAGLYLATERAFTGRQVQRVHVLMARRRRVWPRFEASTHAWQVTAADIVTEPDCRLPQALLRWCGSAWAEWAADQDRVRTMLEDVL